MGHLAPTLLVVGEHDRSDSHASADVLTRVMPHARTAVLPGAGHLAPLEQPRGLRDLLLSFMAEEP